MVRQRVLQKDWSIVDDVGTGTGPSVVADLQVLATDANEEEVRELALACLNNVGGAIARETFLAALHDSREMIRARACVFLRGHRDPSDIVVLHSELRSNPDEYVREHVALMIGEIGGRASLSPLRDQLEAEADPFARDAMILALARLGDERGRDSVVLRLAVDDPAARYAALRACEYVEDRRLMRHVLPLLGDEREAVNIGASHAEYYVRVCDVAVRVLSSTFSVPVGFDIEPFRRYTASELNAALRASQDAGNPGPSAS
jgi:HEAT repeat protein